ncbi:MAG: GNAT family N-acetyltransferase [Bradymonadales bacterium]|nr:GNAT family N-acetyltransferase [Bradymonadales bacterium]
MSIVLEPMSDADYDVFIRWSIESFAADKARVEGLKPEQALQYTRAQVDQMLADGVHTEHHHFFRVLLDDREDPIGAVWIMLQPSLQSAYLCDIVIYEPHRHQGHGKSTLKAVEKWAQSHECQTLYLHVWLHNSVARHLYESTGYTATGINMVKKLA